MVKDVSPNADALRKPIDFKYIYHNYGSDAPRRVSIWRPDCPDKYVALGYVANPSYDKPSISTTNFRCVNENIATFGKWKWVWNGVNSGAERIASIWRADPETIRGDGVGVWAMSAVPFYGNMEAEKSVVLKAANVSLRFQKPIKSMKITNLVYDWDNTLTLSQGPSELTSGARTYFDNCGE